MLHPSLVRMRKYKGVELLYGNVRTLHLSVPVNFVFCYSLKERCAFLRKEWGRGLITRQLYFLIFGGPIHGGH